MNINKAIEIKIQWRKDNYPSPLADEMNADMLAIEALKRCKVLAENNPLWAAKPLPGETEE